MSAERYEATATTCQWACTVCGAAVPVETQQRHDAWHDNADGLIPANQGSNA